MNDIELRAVARIETMTDVAALRTMAANARGKSEEVERAAVRRLAEVAPRHASSTVEHACWTMVYAVEELRRLADRKGIRMTRMRDKIARDGELSALESCVSRRTQGFDEVLSYGAPELLAEVIVLRHASHFPEPIKRKARARLNEAGVEVDSSGKVLTHPGLAQGDQRLPPGHFPV